MTKRYRDLAKPMLLIIAVSTVSKLMGLIRESSLAANFGASNKTDAYKFALEITLVLISVFSYAVVTTFIPVYHNVSSRNDAKKKQYFVNNLFCITTIVSIILVILGFINAGTIVRVFAPGFEGQTYELTVKLTRMILPCITFYILSNLATGYLQANNRFFIPVFTESLYNLIIIISIAFFYTYGIEIVAAASALAIVCQFFFQIPSVLRLGHRFKFVLDFTEEGFVKIRGLILPILISGAFNQIYIVIDRLLASGLKEGSITSLDFASRVNGLGYNVFILSIVTVIFPNLSAESGNMEKFRSILSRGINIIVYISLPLTVGIFLLRTPIVGLLFQRGAFNAENTYTTAAALSGFCMGTVGVGLREILNRAFYSLENTKTPMMNGMIAICINIVLSIVFVRLWNVWGLAFGTSLSAIISSGMLLVHLKRQIGCINGHSIVKAFLKAALASLVMGIFVYYSDKFGFGGLISGRTLKLSASVCLGVLVYTGVLFAEKVDELMFVADIIKQKILRKAIDIV